MFIHSFHEETQNTLALMYQKDGRKSFRSSSMFNGYEPYNDATSLGDIY